MAYIKYNPFWEFENIFKDMGRIINAIPKNINNQENIELKPYVDISEDDKNIFFDMELPGANKEDIKISINDENILNIRGEKKLQKQDTVNSCCKNEIQYGVFNRAFQLPGTIDPQSVEAKFENGVLNIRIAKILPLPPQEKEISIM